jgi:hypothetical protein
MENNKYICGIYFRNISGKIKSAISENQSAITPKAQ